VRDQSEFIQDSINDVLVNLLIGILLTTLVLFLFLHSWRGTIIAAAAMPVTIISTFLLMDMAGFTLNVMTLMALSITVGILVTNTIVVLENIYRHLDLGRGPEGARRVEGHVGDRVAVAASTLTNLVVFTPIAFMEGIIGQFFYAFGLTVVFATLFSIFISFTLAPLLAARLLRTNETEHEETEGRLAPLWRRWDEGYRELEHSYRDASAGRSRGRATAGSSSARSSCSRSSRSSCRAASSAASSSRRATRARSASSSSCPPGRRSSAPARSRCARSSASPRSTTSSRC
jgi:multidrug efflux pump subunit AcrB